MITLVVREAERPKKSALAGRGLKVIKALKFCELYLRTLIAGTGCGAGVGGGAEFMQRGVRGPGIRRSGHDGAPGGLVILGFETARVKARGAEEVEGDDAPASRQGIGQSVHRCLILPTDTLRRRGP